MPPPTPLHASERKLGWFMLAAIALPVTLRVLLFRVPVVRGDLSYLGHWLHGQWGAVFRGFWPRLAMYNFFPALAVTLFVGTFILVPWRLYDLLGRRHGSSPPALWFWTGLFGLVPVALAAWCLYLIFIQRINLSTVRPGVLAVVVCDFIIGLVIVVFGFRGWQRRRREDRAALAADPPADAALPD